MLRLPTIGLAASALLACGGRGVLPEFDQAAPEAAAFQLEVASAPTGDAAATAHNSMPSCLNEAQEAAQELNATLTTLFLPVATAMAHEPTVANQTLHEWPPVDINQATYRFSMKALDSIQFGWKLEAKRLGAADSTYATVMTGFVNPGTEYRRGSGQLGFDLRQIANTDSSFPGAGALYLSFSHGNGSTVLAFSLEEYSPNLAVRGPITATAYGVRLSDGSANTHIAAYGDLCDSEAAGNAALVMMRVRWDAAHGGRADAVALVGAVPAGEAYVTNQCWDSNWETGWTYERSCEVLAGTLGQCQPVKTQGQFAACSAIAGLQIEKLPPLDATSAVAEEGAPPLVPPMGMPVCW